MCDKLKDAEMSHRLTFTLQERHLHEERGSVASFWRGNDTDYDIQAWLAHKMKSQKEKVKLGAHQLY